jgi:hypothetical protein
VSALGARVFLEASIPNVLAKEYTVMLDNGIDPPNRFLNSRQRAAPIIVVQNVYPSEEPGPALWGPVAVRVVGNSARVIAAPPPPFPQQLLAAVAPMPVPLQDALTMGAPPPVESHGYRQPLYQHWTIEP